MLRKLRPLLQTLGVLAVLMLSGKTSHAQAPVYVPAAPRGGYVTVPAAPTYRVAPRTYYAPRPTRYTYRTTPYQRYRRSIQSGRDPNWAAGRGLRLYKPWEY